MRAVNFHFSTERDIEAIAVVLIEYCALIVDINITTAFSNRLTTHAQSRLLM